MTELVLGVDGGGTKTHAVVADSDGNIVGTGTGGPSNWEAVGLEAMTDVIAATAGAALSATGRRAVDVAVFALAGCDWPSDVGRIDGSLASLRLSVHQTVLNDADAALRAGTSKPFGIASVAGTGGSTTGRNPNGVRFRTYAVSFGEGSGASGIVRDALHAIARAALGSGEETRLTDDFLDRVGFRSAAELFESLTRTRGPRVDASFAPLVTAAAAAGDAVAQSVVATNGRQHAADVVGVARNLGMLDSEFDVVRAGGVHRAGSEVFDRAFTELLARELPYARTVGLRVAPVAGAVLLALEHSRRQPVAAPVFERLSISLSEIR